MNEIIKIWLAEMFEKEISAVKGAISNNQIWRAGCMTADDAQMYDENIASLEEYKQVLEELVTQAEEGTLNA